jgi:hypothetical protein
MYYFEDINYNHIFELPVTLLILIVSLLITMCLACAVFIAWDSQFHRLGRNHN